jgi:hypothetical protein
LLSFAFSDTPKVVLEKGKTAMVELERHSLKNFQTPSNLFFTVKNGYLAQFFKLHYPFPPIFAITIFKQII